MALPFWAQDGDCLSFGEPQPLPVLIADNKISFEAPLSSLANYSSAVPAPKPPLPPNHIPKRNTHMPAQPPPPPEEFLSNTGHSGGRQLGPNVATSSSSSAIAAAVAARARAAKAQLRASQDGSGYLRSSMEHAGSIDVAGPIIGAKNYRPQQQQQQHHQQEQQQPEHRQSNTAQVPRQSAQANAASTASSAQPLEPSIPHQRSSAGKPITVAKGSGSTTVNTNQPTRRRVNTENALYEGTVRGPRVTANTSSRFVGAAVQRAQERAKEARRAQKKKTCSVGVVELGDGLRQFSFADENAAPPARGGFELFLDVKSREWDPEGAKLHPKAVQQRASALWRSMPSDSEPGNRHGRSFWQQKADKEAHARHAVLESEWERRNPLPNAKTTSAARSANEGVRVARPLRAKRTVFELKRGAVGLRPDRVANEVFEGSLRNPSQSVPEVAERTVAAAAKPRGGTLALSREAPVTQPRHANSPVDDWRLKPSDDDDGFGYGYGGSSGKSRDGATEPSAVAKKGPWRARPRPEWERPWQTKQAPSVPPQQPGAHVHETERPQQQEQAGQPQEQPKQFRSQPGSPSRRGGTGSATGRSSLENGKELLAEYWQSWDVPLSAKAQPSSLSEAPEGSAPQANPINQVGSGKWQDMDDGLDVNGEGGNAAQRQAWLVSFLRAHHHHDATNNSEDANRNGGVPSSGADASSGRGKAAVKSGEAAVAIEEAETVAARLLERWVGQESLLFARLRRRSAQVRRLVSQDEGQGEQDQRIGTTYPAQPAYADRRPTGKVSSNSGRGGGNKGFAAPTVAWQQQQHHGRQEGAEAKASSTSNSKPSAAAAAAVTRRSVGGGAPSFGPPRPSHRSSSTEAPRGQRLTPSPPRRRVRAQQPPPLQHQVGHPPQEQQAMPRRKTSHRSSRAEAGVGASPPRRAANVMAPSPQGWQRAEEAFHHNSGRVGEGNAESEDDDDEDEDNSDDDEDEAVRRSVETPSRGRSTATSTGSTQPKAHVTRSTSPFDESVLRTVLPRYAPPLDGTTNDETWHAPRAARVPTGIPVTGMTKGSSSFHSGADAYTTGPNAPAWHHQHTHYRGGHDLPSSSSSSTEAATAGANPGAATTLASAMAEIMGGAAVMLQESMRDALKSSHRHQQTANKQTKRRRSRVSRSKHQAERGREEDSASDTSDGSSDDDSSSDDDTKDNIATENGDEVSHTKGKSGRNGSVALRHSNLQPGNPRSGATSVAHAQAPQMEPGTTTTPHFSALSRQLEALEAHQAKIAAKLQARQSQRLMRGASRWPLHPHNGASDGGATATALDSSDKPIWDPQGNFADSMLLISPSTRNSAALPHGGTATNAVAGAATSTTVGTTTETSRQATTSGTRGGNSQRPSSSQQLSQLHAQQPTPERTALPDTSSSALPWRSNTVPQPIDVSLPLSTSRALSDHARAFAAHRRAVDLDCLAKVTNTAPTSEILGSVAGLVDLLSEDLVTNLVSDCSTELESIVAECASAVLERV